MARNPTLKLSLCDYYSILLFFFLLEPKVHFVLQAFVIPLCCNSFLQIFHSSDGVDVSPNDSLVGPAAKKRKVSYNVEGVLEEIYSTSDGRSYWQW